MVLPNFSSEQKRGSDLALPLYEVVKRQISEKILLGHWEPGTALPSEVALSQTYGVAVGTIRRALLDLTNEGVLSRRRKTGTVVTGRTPQHNLRFFFQYFRLHGRDGTLQKSTTKITSLERGEATAEEAEKLQIDSQAAVIRFHRVRYVADRPVMHETLVLPSGRVPDFPDNGDEIPPLLYLHLLDRYGIRISAVREQIWADLAGEDDARWLDLAMPSALLVIDEISYDQSAVPVLLATHRARTNDHRYINEVQ